MVVVGHKPAVSLVCTAALSTGQWYLAKSSVGLHCCCATAHLCELDVSIYVFAVSQACCQPGWHSSLKSDHSINCHSAFANSVWLTTLFACLFLQTLWLCCTLTGMHTMGNLLSMAYIDVTNIALCCSWMCVFAFQRQQGQGCSTQPQTGRSAH